LVPIKELIFFWKLKERRNFLMRVHFYLISLFIFGSTAFIGNIYPLFYSTLFLTAPLFIIGLSDIFQKSRAIRRNFPVIGHFRYLLEEIRPEIQQYFIESNSDGMPFSREKRSVVYQRAKKVTDTIPFGTQLDVNADGYEWMNHSIAAAEPPKQEPRVWIGKETCKKPYLSSLLNISAMSFGSMSKNAILALNQGAKEGGFAHNTGEGGISPYHIKPGGDLIWQIGTGYFGCRTKDGNFDPILFSERSQSDQVKMIEIKLSQGAKPGHGGVLPGKKVSAEVAQIRNVEIGKTVNSPPYHKTFSTPKGLLEFIVQLRELSGGKPVGIKLCVGRKIEFLALCKAMVSTGITPDFITVDGTEGGTGAAPLEFSNYIGTPLNEGLSFIHSALIGCGLRKKTKLIASGKVITGFNIFTKIALGADICNSARGMMFALGCIQALRCNHNNCPTGVATQDPQLMKGLVIEDKSKRVANFHSLTVKSFLEVMGSAGITHPSQIRPYQVLRRVSQTEVKDYSQIYPLLKEGAFLRNEAPEKLQMLFELSHSDEFYRPQAQMPYYEDSPVMI